MKTIAKPKRSPLRPPDVALMDTIERELTTAAQRAAKLWEAYQATLGPLEVANERLDRHLDGQAPERVAGVRLREELEAAKRMNSVAVEAWRAADAIAGDLRHDWLQLQVIRAFYPRCALCERMVGPVYLALGRDQRPPALCLACMDSWACDYDPASGRRPPSHWIETVAQEARERETARRQLPPEEPRLRVLGPDDMPPEPPSARPCWHCGGPVDDLGNVEHLYAGEGALPPRVVLKVAALVPLESSPEEGEVCLPCIDQDLELHGRWAEIERDLCDPTRLRHEQALHRFVQDGTLPFEGHAVR